MIFASRHRKLFAMMNTSDALRAHARCRSRLATCLGKNWASVDLKDFTPHPECNLVRFLKDAENLCGPLAEIGMARTAHATVHSVALGLAQKRMTGLVVDIDTEFSEVGNFGSASSLLVSSLWRLEKKLHTMAG